MSVGATPFSHRFAMAIAPSDERVHVVTREYAEEQQSKYDAHLRQLCQIDAAKRRPSAPETCPICGVANSTFKAILTYKDAVAGKWYLLVSER